MQGTQLAVDMTSATLDRRAGRRFKLRLTCRISSPWEDAGELTGVTEDMSRSGILLTLDGSVEVLPAIGDTLKIIVDLPQSPNISPRCMVCMTKVVRVIDPQDAPASLAVQIHRVQVQDVGVQPAEFEKYGRRAGSQPS